MKFQCKIPYHLDKKWAVWFTRNLVREEPVIYKLSYKLHWSEAIFCHFMITDYHTPCFNEVERWVYWFHFVHLSNCGQNPVCSVSSTILAGSIYIYTSYLEQLQMVYDMFFGLKFFNNLNFWQIEIISHGKYFDIGKLKSYHVTKQQAVTECELLYNFLLQSQQEALWEHKPLPHLVWGVGNSLIRHKTI